MRIIIAGGRDFANQKRLHQVMDGVLKRQIIDKGVEEVEFVVGRAKGADALGEQWAVSRGCPVSPFPADWETFGKSAGMIRNKQMAEYTAKSPDKMKLLVAFWDGKSRGTLNMIETATQLSIPTMIVPY